MQINLNQLRCLYMAARHKSMAEAAARLFVSPPAITMQIKKLEQALGMKLVFRQNNELRLTEQGKRVYAHAVSIFEQVEKLEKTLEGMAERGMELLIGVYHIPAQYLMPALLDHLQRLCPSLRVRMILGTQAESLRRLSQHEVHCALVADTGQKEQFKALPICRDRLLLIAAQNSSWISSSQIVAKELNHIPLLLPQQGTGILAKIEHFLKQHQIEPQVAMADISGDVIKQFIARDAGLGFLLVNLVRRELADGVLREITIEEGNPQVQFFLVMHANHQAPQLDMALDALASFNCSAITGS